MSRALYVDPESLRVGTVELGREDTHYLRRVLRLEPGARLRVFDGQGRCAAVELVELGPDSAQLRCGAVETRERARPAVHVAIAVVKGERMDWAIQKLSELGVATVAPMITERTVAKVSVDKIARRTERYLAIARAAARQSENLFVPTIRPPARMCEVLEAMPPDSARLICVARSGVGLRDALTSESGCGDVALAIGPEGGFTDQEVEQAVASGFVAASLGPQILRVETAAIAASVLAAHLPHPPKGEG